MWPLYLNIIDYFARISHFLYYIILYYINVLASLTAVWTSWGQELHSIVWIGIPAYSAYRVSACSMHSLGCPGWSLEQRAPFPHQHLQHSIKFLTCLPLAQSQAAVLIFVADSLVEYGAGGYAVFKQMGRKRDMKSTLPHCWKERSCDLRNELSASFPGDFPFSIVLWVRQAGSQ